MELQELDSVDMLDGTERLCQDVSGLRCGRDLTNIHIAGFIRETNKVMTRVNVFRTRVTHIVFDVLECRF